ncbi:hypothetical protein D9M72_583610 [compost metagenome]
MRKATPLIAWQQLNRPGRLGKEFAFVVRRSNRERHRRGLGFCESSQKRAIELDVEIANSIALTRRDSIQSPSLWFDERRCRTKG